MDSNGFMDSNNKKPKQAKKKNRTLLYIVYETRRQAKATRRMRTRTHSSVDLFIIVVVVVVAGGFFLLALVLYYENWAKHFSTGFLFCIFYFFGGSQTKALNTNWESLGSYAELSLTETKVNFRVLAEGRNWTGRGVAGQYYCQRCRSLRLCLSKHNWEAFFNGLISSFKFIPALYEGPTART